MDIFADQYNCCCPDGESDDILPALEEGSGKEEMDYRIVSWISKGHPWANTHTDVLYHGLEAQMLFQI